MKILIVDDERVEREGLISLIHKFKYELDIDTAQNGKDALMKCHKGDYDIILTDIKMPYMDGIAFLTELQKISMDPLCIVYSAYGEFEYAQSAIKLGVVEYLLKPIELDKFKELFDRVISICDDKKKSEEKNREQEKDVAELKNIKLGKELLQYLEGDSEVISGMPDNALDFMEQSVLPVFICENTALFSYKWEECENLIKKCIGEKLFLVNADDETMLLIVPFMREDEIEKTFCDLIEAFKREFGKDIFIIAGAESGSYEILRKEYQRMKQQLDYRFFISDGRLFLQNQDYVLKREENNLKQYVNRISEDAKIRDYNGMRESFRQLFSYLEENVGFSSIYVKSVCMDVIKGITEQIDTKVYIMEYVERIFQTRSMGELANEIQSFIDDISLEQQKKGKETHLSAHAKELIYSEYSESGLSVSLLAEKLDVSMAYLSSSFKADTGQNLSKFITQVRLSKAKELLVESNLKVNVISARVGYPNTSYFIALFKANEGCSPAQYRNRVGEDAK